MVVIFFSFVIVLVAGTVCSADVYDVKDYGATGNGSTSDTAAINAAITAADANGGGTIYFPTGTYKSGSIIMKNNITLELTANATLLATSSAEYSSVDDNPWDEYQDWGHSHWKSSLIWGIEVNNVAVTGAGLINGNAMTAGDPADGYGDRAISFKLCSGVLIKDIRIYRAGHFGIITTGCNDVTIDNVLIDTNRDGINIDCCNDVNIINCIVNSPGDDAICMKSSYGLGYKRPTENVTISKCTVMGHGDGYLLPQFPEGDEKWHAGRIKFGTESNGGFKNITITDCNFEYCYGFMLATVDGGDIENIIIDNIQMTDLFSPPIFMRLGNRARGPGPPPPGIYRNVNISNITAEADHSISSIMSGMPGHLIEDVNFSNITIHYPGGGPASWADTVLGENEAGSPDAFMFGQITPSYAFYVRHANNVEFHGCSFDFDTNDERPAFVLVDVNGFELDNVDAERYYTSGDHIKFDDVDNVNIHDSVDFPAVTATYGTMQVSPPANITAGDPFAIITTATSGSDGICTTDLFADSNYFDSGYTWLNGSVPEDVNLDGLQLEKAGHYLMEIDTRDLTVDIYPLGDFDFSGNVDFEDHATFSKDWLKETDQISLPGDPVAWWEFEEGSGSYAYDSSVNSNTGTLQNMDSSDWVSGYDGAALDFDGGNDYIHVPDSDSISVGGGDYTICAWIYPHSISGDRGIVAKIYSNSDKEYAFSLGNDGAPDGALVLDVEVAANDGAESTDAVVTTNEWQHVMVVFDSVATDAAFYYNFEPVPVVSDSITAAHVASGDNLCIGRWGGKYNSKYFDGIIDDVRIYNYKLQSASSSQADINQDGIVDSIDLDIFLENWLGQID